MMKRLIDKILSRKVEEEDMSSYELEELKKDLKEMAKISTEVMKKLEGEELKKFKNSEEFKRFMDILKTNKLVKEE